MFFFHVVNIVGGDHFEVELTRPFDQVAIDDLLFGNTVVLEFEVEVFLPEDLFEPIDCVTCFLEFAVGDACRNFTGQASGQCNQAILMIFENVLVDAGFVIVTVQMGIRDQFDQIFIAGFVLGKEDQVIVDFLAPNAGFFLQAAAGGHIDLATDDGFDARLVGCLIEIDGAVHHTMIGDRHGWKLQFLGILHEPVYLTGGIQ